MFLLLPDVLRLVHGLRRLHLQRAFAQLLGEGNLPLYLDSFEGRLGLHLPILVGAFESEVYLGFRELGETFLRIQKSYFFIERRRIDVDSLELRNADLGRVLLRDRLLLLLIPLSLLVFLLFLH